MDYSLLTVAHVLDAIPDAVLVVGLDGVILTANVHCEAVLGYRPDELVGTSVDMLIPEELRVTHASQHRAYFAAEPRVRPMGEAAGRGSDFVVLTSDNPRSEDPLVIINDAMVGLQKSGTRYKVEPDRRAAIALAIREAGPGDIVLLAGKGHETTQVLRDRTIDFDDREMARRILRQRGYGE